MITQLTRHWAEFTLDSSQYWHTETLTPVTLTRIYTSEFTSNLELPINRINVHVFGRWGRSQRNPTLIQMIVFSDSDYNRH